MEPADQGIIKNFKVFYRAEIVFCVLHCMNPGKSYKATILGAMNIADEAWRSVTQKTIRNCFLSCGFQNVSMNETTVNNN